MPARGHDRHPEPLRDICGREVIRQQPQVLKVLAREGNTLSPVVRNAWDDKPLQTTTRHSPVRATGLRQLLEHENFEVADAGIAEAALQRLPTFAPNVSADQAPDVVVLGVNRPAACDGESIRLVREAMPSAAVVVLALVMNDAHVLRAVRAGAVGYLLKDAELERIVAGIHDAACGQSALSVPVARVVIDGLRRSSEPEAPAPTQPLRERAVLSLLASGCDNSQIGDRLFMSGNTVKNYVSRVLEKLEVDNRLQAATTRSAPSSSDEPPSRRLDPRADIREELAHESETGAQPARRLLQRPPLVGDAAGLMSTVGFSQ